MHICLSVYEAMESTYLLEFFLVLFFMHSSCKLKWTAMLIPFPLPASWNFIFKKQNNLMSSCHIKSKSVDSEGYLPSQLQGMLTLVSEYEYSDNVLCLPLNFIGHVHPVWSHAASVVVYYIEISLHLYR